MKTITQILKPRKIMWNIVTENGIVLATFSSKICAQNNLSRYKLSRYEKLKVVEQ